TGEVELGGDVIALLLEQGDPGLGELDGGLRVGTRGLGGAELLLGRRDTLLAVAPELRRLALGLADGGLGRALALLGLHPDLLGGRDRARRVLHALLAALGPGELQLLLGH